ncbi:putative major facilitator superfamily transporter [Nocardia brasiliensis NBRC 14402]|uniref:MFS transporter n=1 Tax=Nocardia brasiliensis TaxID=37326 RepID=UPI0002FC6C8E|nr:MFS transporter [Nocardia brasiliensis]GAJ83197.1 putative major facilitator superfamily transporter [Nocardia brasiliensis NBRC 14402]SUB10224.1 Spectinomycin tetracycline efflux pump [Nocardia brasiliensis]
MVKARAAEVFTEMNGRAWGVLAVLCGAIFLEGIDVAMLNVALPSIRAELGLSTGMLSGVVSAYVLGYGGFVLLGGRAADLLGRRRMFLFWLTVFLVFSGLGGFATTGWMLLTARFVTGVAAAFLAPAGLSLITTNFAEGQVRDRALVVYAGIGAGGFTLGMVAGGLLTALGWRWVFFVPVLVSALLLAAAYVLVRDSGVPQRVPGLVGFDLLGALSVTGAMLLLVYGVVRLEHLADGPVLTGAVFAAGFAALALFVLNERRAVAPLVRLGVLRSVSLVRTNLVAVLFMGAFMGFQFAATLYFQELRGWSTVQTGLAMAVLGLDAVVAPLLTPWLVRTFGTGRVIFGGAVLAALAYLLFLPSGLDRAYVALLPTLLLIALAFALVYGPLTIAGTDDIAAEEHGLAGGLLYTAIQFGVALGVSVVTAVNVAAVDAGKVGMDALRTALIVPVIAAILAGVVAATGLRRNAKPAVVPNPEQLVHV